MPHNPRFPLIVPIEVRFRDIDGLGHVNNAVYLTYFEQARVAYGMKLAGARTLKDVTFILAETTISYKQPAFFGDQLSLGVRVSHIGTKSFTMEYELLRNNEELIAVGRSVQVWYDYTAGRSVPVPDSFRQAAAAMQGGIFE